MLMSTLVDDFYVVYCKVAKELWASFDPGTHRIEEVRAKPIVVARVLGYKMILIERV